VSRFGCQYDDDALMKERSGSTIGDDDDDSSLSFFFLPCMGRVLDGALFLFISIFTCFKTNSFYIDESEDKKGDRF